MKNTICPRCSATTIDGEATTHYILCPLLISNKPTQTKKLVNKIDELKLQALSALEKQFQDWNGFIEIKTSTHHSGEVWRTATMEDLTSFLFDIIKQQNENN